jgi:hypothetical protein
MQKAAVSGSAQSFCCVSANYRRLVAARTAKALLPGSVPVFSFFTAAFSRAGFQEHFQ